MKGKKMVGALSLGVLYSTMYLLPYIKYIFYDALLEGTGLNNTQLGMSLSVYIALSIATTMFSGYLADKYDIKKMLVISGFAHGALSCVYPFFMSSYVATLLIYAGLGVTSILLFWSQCFKGISMLGPEEEQGKLYGWFESFNGLGSMVINFAALWLFARFATNQVTALKAVVFFYAATSIIATILVMLFYKPNEINVQQTQEQKEDKVTTKEILQVLKMPQVWVFAFVIFGIYAFYAGSSYLTPYFSSVLGVTVVFSGALATLKNYGTRFVGGPIAGIISDKITTGKFLLYGFIAMLALMVVFMLMPANPAVLIPVMILMFLLAFVNVGMKGVMFSLTDEINISQRVNGTAIAAGTLIGFNLPDLLLHPIFGSWLDRMEAVAAYKLIFATLTGFLVVGFISILIILWMYRGKQTQKAKA